MTLNGDVTITGPGSDRLTITVPGSNFNRRTFRVSPTANITLRGMTLQRTGTENGGGIGNMGKLTLEDVVIANVNYNGTGGGIFNLGHLTLLDCQISGGKRVPPTAMMTGSRLVTSVPLKPRVRPSLQRPWNLTSSSCPISKWAKLAPKMKADWLVTE